MFQEKGVFIFCSIWLIAVLSSCSDKLKVYPNVYDTDSTVSVTINHPAMLHTDSDFIYVKAKVDAGTQPWKNAYDHLTVSAYAQSSYTPSPVKLLARLDQTNWQATYPNDWSNYTHLMYDAAAAYQLALRWKISGDDQYAVTAINILNAWATTCTGYIVNSAGDFIDPNEYLIAIQINQLANAAEILRASDKWAQADFDKYKNWMVTVFYPHLTQFLSLHGDETACPLHYWANWDLAAMTGILSIGILTDDNSKINEAIQYFKNGVGSGNIYNAVPFVFQDPDSQEALGECQESGRDQGHATLDVSLIGVFCQMAKNVGVDLFTYADNRALAMCEYIAKYNYGSTEARDANNKGWLLSNFKYPVSSVPYTAYTNCAGSWPSISYQEHLGGTDTRGTVRPSWELIDRLAGDYGLSDIYTKMWVDLMRQNATLGFNDGGGGDYGPDSNGFDQLGYGTLMFAK